MTDFTIAQLDEMIADAAQWHNNNTAALQHAAPDLAAQLRAALVREQELMAETDARIEALESGVQFIECACGHDTKTDVCLGHAPIVDAIVAKRMAASLAREAKLRKALEAILNSGEWYCSALEIDTHRPGCLDGDKLEALARRALGDAS